MRFRQYINRLRKQPHPIICRSAGAGVSRPGTRTPKHSHKNPGSPAERGLAGHRPVRENVRPPCQRFPQGRKGLHSPKDVPRRDSPRRKTVPSRSVLFGTPTMSALPPLRRIVSVFLRAAVVRPRRLPFGFGGPQKTRPTKNVPQKSAASMSKPLSPRAPDRSNARPCGIRPLNGEARSRFSVRPLHSEPRLQRARPMNPPFPHGRKEASSRTEILEAPSFSSRFVGRSRTTSDRTLPNLRGEADRRAACWPDRCS